MLSLCHLHLIRRQQNPTKQTSNQIGCKGLISLESFLKLMIALNGLEKLVQSVKPDDSNFSSIDDVLASTEKKSPKKGWRT